MSDKIRINVLVGGKRYPFNINRKDEEVFRKAAKMVDGRYAKFLQETALDPKDCFAVIAIESYVKNTREGASSVNEEATRGIDDIYDILQKEEAVTKDKQEENYKRSNGLLF